MISLLTNNKLNEHKNSLLVTYPRTVNIIFGNYPYPDIIHNFILEIKNNLSKDWSNYTNIKGGRTSWDQFIDNPLFNNFMTFFINNHQSSHPDLFQNFFSKNTIIEAWGNEIKKGDSVGFHTHHFNHGILYLNKGCSLILPELNIKITPEPGDYYFFPPHISHGFNTYEGDTNRYSLVFNIAQNKMFSYDKKIKEKNEKQNR